MKLEDTVNLMFDNNYKVRVKAEYWQVRNRADRLKTLLKKYRDSKSDFRSNSGYNLLSTQLRIMEDYQYILEQRSLKEDIIL